MNKQKLFESLINEDTGREITGTLISFMLDLQKLLQKYNVVEIEENYDGDNYIHLANGDVINMIGFGYKDKKDINMSEEEVKNMLVRNGYFGSYITSEEWETYNH